MEEEKTYWFITVFEGFKNQDTKYDIMPKNVRTWGFYTNKKDALEALYTNTTDMWETVYNYAILEPYLEGISGYNFNESRHFFKYNKEKNGYEEIEQPKWLAHIVGFAMG